MARHKHSLYHILVLLFFCTYAVSPICLNVSTGLNSAQQDSDASKQYTIGIIWIKVCLSQVLGIDFDDADGDGTKDVTILIKKKRAVLKSYSIPKPVQNTYSLPLQAQENIALALHDHDIELDPRDHAADGWQHLSTGLAPPLSLS
jgi:hypothetical protein